MGRRRGYLVGCFPAAARLWPSCRRSPWAGGATRVRTCLDQPGGDRSRQVMGPLGTIRGRTSARRISRSSSAGVIRPTDSAKAGAKQSRVWALVASRSQRTCTSRALTAARPPSRDRAARPAPGSGRRAGRRCVATRGRRTTPWGRWRGALTGRPAASSRAAATSGVIGGGGSSSRMRAASQASTSHCLRRGARAEVPRRQGRAAAVGATGAITPGTGIGSVVATGGPSIGSASSSRGRARKPLFGST